MAITSVRPALPHQPAAVFWVRFQRWQDQVREPALTVLLVIQLTFLFIVGPLSNINALPHYLLDGAQVVMPMVSFFALQRHNKVRLLILVTIAPMIWVLFAGSNIYIGMLLRTLVTLAVTVAVAQAVFQARKVTRHQLLGAVVVYLNIALLFVGAFAGVKCLFPDAFMTLSKAPLQSGELVYFSLTTITSTGYGDILPVHPLARSLANLEAVSGQLFLGVFLARLVSLHGSFQGFKQGLGF
ncbi:potassium channel family protein [Hymenobacter sp. GOD-10R]|uniref:potassium channel family protein n=1 Tax=Hymenobacter sp. GOD-10R TaxID=3093922 RepID=UPI002D7885EE|nr:potassium channel family protein [Hymenobacter sp. GOD-10R]WRQ30385.1 potassium channel family protein [Hymenobacter sp. GOD-10R]